MKKKNLAILIIAFLEVLIFIAAVVWPIKYQTYFWEQDQLLHVDENCDIIPGFYLNQPEDTGDSEYIESGIFRLKKGCYTVRVKYDSAGGGKLRVLYADGRYRDDLAGNLLLREDLHEMSFDIKVKDSERDLVIRGFQRLDRGKSDYLLIREISVQTSGNTKLLRLAALLAIFIILDMVFWAFSCAGVRDGFRKNALLIAVFSIVLFLTGLPLFVSYLPSEMLDIRFHITRIEGLRQGLLSGAYPVRIQPGWLNEHGYATSVFYGDLFLYFPAVLTLLGVPLQTAYQCFVLAVNIATIWITFYCCKKMTGNKNIAMFAGILYTGNLYRMTALYMRAAVGAYCAMIFFPLIILGLWEIYKLEDNVKKPGKGWLPLAIGFSGILEAHIISFEMTAAFTALLCLALWKKTFRKDRFFALCKAVVTTILMNLWFLVPFLDYLRDDFQINSKGAYAGDHYKLQERGLFLPQIFSSDFEVVSASKNIATGVQGEMPLTIGMALTMVLIAGILLWAYKIQKKEKWQEFCLCLCMTLFSFALTLSFFPYIQIGRIMPYIQMAFRSIQYSWRFLTISTALLLWMFCLVGMELEKKNKKLFGYAAAAMCAICIFQAVDFSSDVLNDMGNLEVYSGANLDMNDIGGGEYLPLDTDITELKNRVASTDDVEVEEWRRQYNSISCNVYNRSEQEQKLEVPLLFYRYYRADAGTEKLEVGRAESGRLSVAIPASYKGYIRVYFKEPRLWRAAELISLLAFIGLISMKIWRKR